MKQFSLGIDIGASKILLAIVDIKKGSVLVHRKIRTPQNLSSTETIDFIIKAIFDFLSENSNLKVAKIGIGCPGPINWSQEVVYPLRIPALQGVDIRKLVENRVSIETSIELDSNCFVLGEWIHGVGKGYKNIIGLVVSSGIGSGLILNGEIFKGSSGNAGQIGHIFIDRDAPKCPKGTNGCLTSVASGFALKFLSSKSFEKEIEASQLYSLAKNGDNRAISLISSSGKYVGRALSIINEILDLEIAVIGGGLANAGDFFWNPLLDEFQDKICVNRDLTITKSSLGDFSGAIGAAINSHLV